MLIFPAIDLRGGQVVRLTQGDYSRVSVYAHDPFEVGKGFVRLGAGHLHVVDLDGARDGRPANREIIRTLCSLPLRIQAGGGIRTEGDVEEVIALGVRRVILGTAAVTDFPLVERLVKAHGDKIAVGVDVKGGMAAIQGWQATTEMEGHALCLRLRDAGVATVIYTDISRDGQLGGANLAAYEALTRIEGLRIIASGGISYETEIKRLREMNLYGAILGKALYTGKLSLVRAIAIAKGEMEPC